MSAVDFECLEAQLEEMEVLMSAFGNLNHTIIYV